MSRSPESLEVHRREIVHNATAAGLVKGIAAVLGLALNVVIARLVDIDGAGLYFVALSIVVVAATLGRLGTDAVVVRLIAGRISDGDAGDIRRVANSALVIVSLTSGALSAALMLGSGWLAENAFAEPRLGPVLAWLAPAILFTSLAITFANALQGLKRVRSAMSIIGVWPSALSAIGAILLAPRFGVQGVAAATTAAAALTALGSTWWWLRVTSDRDEGAATADGRTLDAGVREILVPSLHLVSATVALQLVNWLPIAVLGKLVTVAEAGLFAIVNRTAMLITFALIAVNSIAAPKFAALYKQREIRLMESIAREVTLMITLFAAAPTLIFVLLPRQILSVFGPAFDVGAPLLIILSIGRFYNVAMGLAGTMLTMTGNEIQSRRNAWVSLGFEVLACLALIPIAGPIGAALALSLTLIVWNVLAAWAVKRSLGIEITFAAAFGGRHDKSGRSA